MAEIVVSPSMGVEPFVPRQGFLYNWGPQAWIDMFMSNIMLVKRGLPIIGQTFVPILRLSGDKKEVDAAYAALKARREIPRFFDSPREKWRKRYGNLVRELEWALLELRKHFKEEQFRDIVVDACVALTVETSGDFIALLRTWSDRNKDKKGAPRPGAKPRAWENLIFEMFNPAGWLTGPAKITELDPGRGLTVIHIPDCAWHVCARQDSLPNPNALPEQGCLYVCKAPFESLFDGKDGGMRIQFDPHLPGRSCTVRMSWKPS